MTLRKLNTHNFLRTSIQLQDDLLLEHTTHALFLATDYEWVTGIDKKGSVHVLKPETKIHHKLQEGFYLVRNGWKEVQSYYPCVILKRELSVSNAPATDRKPPKDSP